ncbi:MAG TPA: phosphoenolpyruvate--protein phosphotransferase [Candidatus Pelethenecus faecipullorum]|uniref:Phosphoenolpyruvate-protein phosphotransferase n=1 Tax=Candidatus Pelethenecus faecipullorum TaxID=2840900 RepID=A0A9D1KIY7_9MOLU|nr:phosphoenolpyruvate--protein phosphotransferase [Candidatus Pelethenecus faecipullorum]
MKIQKGEVLSEGLAVGSVHLEFTKTYDHHADTIVTEKQKLEDAIAMSLQQINQMRQNDPENEEYLVIQSLLIGDPFLKEKALKMIEDGISASFAIQQILNDSIDSIAQATNRYLKERTLDIQDVMNRILSNLSHDQYPDLTNERIYIAKELHPSYLIQNRNYLLGVITEKGGYSSHAAILCRQWNIPYMICSQLSHLSLRENDEVIIDTRKKHILIAPTQEKKQEYREWIELLSKEEYRAIAHPSFGFLANVSSNKELDKVMEYGFDGVGLYRTEMIFMNTLRPYTFEEQYEIYEDAVCRLQGKPICFRTFDIGDDKQLSYVQTYKKGVDNYIHNPLLFKTQIKALLKANRFNTMKIMFPMITSYQEFLFLKKWVLQIQQEMEDTGTVFIGMMLETKEALEKIEEFQGVDFISIGTNDLTEAIYQIERDDQRQQLKKYLSDLVEKLKKVVLFCQKNKIELSVCGELAAIPQAAKMFYQIGIKNLSVSPQAIKILNKVYKDLYASSHSL